MMDPKTMRLLLGGAEGQAAPDRQDLESRARQGRLSFAATIFALRGQCQCEACQMLRQAIDILLAETKQELRADAPSNPP